MKKLLLFSLIVICSCSFVGCSSDEELIEESPICQEDIKLRIYRMAEEYGLSNVSIQNEKLPNNYLLSDEMIELEVQKLANIRGAYRMIKKDGNKYILRKVSVRKKSIGPSFETWKGTASGEAKEDAYDINITLNYSYNPTERSFVTVDKCTISYSAFKNDQFVEYVEDELNLSEEVYVFSGENSFTYSASFSYKSDYLELEAFILCDYDSEDNKLNCIVSENKQ